MSTPNHSSMNDATSAARKESVRLGHEYTGPEHLLLGVIRDSAGPGARVLADLGVDPVRITQMVTAVIRPGTSTVPDTSLPYTTRAKRSMEFAAVAATYLRHDATGSDHLVAGLLAEQKSVAAQVLNDAGVTLERVLGAVAELHGTPLPPEKWDPSGSK